MAPTRRTWFSPHPTSGSEKENEMNREVAKKLFQGTIVTMVTPFDSEYRVDLGVLRSYIEWLIESGVGTRP
jgi:hypothetical protein